MSDSQAATPAGSSANYPVGIKTPTIDVSDVTGIAETPVLVASAFKLMNTVSGQTDSHYSTSWRIVNAAGEEIWRFAYNTLDLTCIKLPRGLLQANATYQAFCQYFGHSFKSQEGSVEFTTAAAFDYIKTPIISITAGSTNGNTDVLATPTFTGSTFSYTTHARIKESHQATEWKVAITSDPNVALWSKTVSVDSAGNASNLVKITLPHDLLQANNAYRIFLRYIGAKFGPSLWGQLDFCTREQFAYIECPSFSVKGAPDNVQKDPLLTATAFKAMPEDQVDLHESTDWKVISVLDNETVWESLDNTKDLTSIKLPKTVLHSNTPYKFAMRYKGKTLGYSAWSEVEAQTAAKFSPVAQPNVFVEQDELGVYEDPIIVASAFENESGLEGDEHCATDWVVVNTADGSEVWSSHSDSENLRSIQVDKDKLRTNTAYSIRVRYQASISGWGPWSEVNVTTQETFYDTNLPTLQNANIVREGQQLRFDFSTEQLRVKQGRTKPSYLRVKVYNNTTAELVDVFTTEVNPNGNYSVLRTNPYDINEEDDFDFQVFYKKDKADNDLFPCSAVATRPATFSDEPSIFLENIKGGQFSVIQYPTITFSLHGSHGANAFTHLKTDWEIKDITDSTTVWSSIADTQHLTQIKCDFKLNRQNFYLLNIRAYISHDIKQDAQVIAFTTKIITTANSYYLDIGTPGKMGFGVGLYNGTDLKKLDLTLMEGGDDTNNDNYGNYQHPNGSIFCFVPAFCYSFTKKGLKNKGTPNAIYIKSFSDFKDEDDANAHGYILHRAFIDGGEIKKGFFVSKYLMGQGCKATKDNIPFSLCLNYMGHTYVNSGKKYSVFACDSVSLSKKLGDQYNCASAFIYSALNMLSYCHGLFATSTDYCAWFDPNKEANFPKGCNNNALGDVNDSSVKYTSDDLTPQKPNTGSATPFAKTTHNGQNCGVCDLNGCMEQVAVGVLFRKNYCEKALYVLHESAKLADFEFNEDKVGVLYESIPTSLKTSFSPCPSWGSDKQCSFYPDNKGNNRALCGVMPPFNGEGTTEFGKASVYLNDEKNDYHRVLTCSGGWDSKYFNVSIWSRRFSISYLDGYINTGFRSAVYGE